MKNKENFPNTFILGASKCGTTSLYDILKEHPDIYFSIVKEPQFFSNDDLYSEGICSYIKKHFKNSAGFKCRVDASPHYLYYKKAAQRIFQDIGGKNIKFIVILREPVSRAYSLYWNMVREGYESLGFRDALDKEKERLDDGAIERLGTVRYQYLSSGLYAQQLEQYFEYFERESFLILFHEDLKNKPKAVIKQVTEFLGVNELENTKDQSSNMSSMPKNRWIHSFLRGKSIFKKIAGFMLPYNIKYLLVTRLINMNLREENYPPLDENLKLIIKKSFTKDIDILEKMTGRKLDEWR